MFTPGTAVLWGLVVPSGILSAWAGYVYIYLPWSLVREARRLMTRLDRVRADCARLRVERDHLLAERDHLEAEHAQLKDRLNGF